MKTYRVTVNGEVYEVTVEEVKAPTPGVTPARGAAPAPPPAPLVSPPQATPKPASPPPPAPAPAAGLGGKEVQAPMPGKILDVKVALGDAVKSGSLLAILEAMKMENDITAPVDGTVKSVNVSAGDSVNTGDVLVVID